MPLNGIRKRQSLIGTVLTKNVRAGHITMEGRLFFALPPPLLLRIKQSEFL